MQARLMWCCCIVVVVVNNDDEEEGFVMVTAVEMVVVVQWDGENVMCVIKFTRGNVAHLRKNEV